VYLFADDAKLYKHLLNIQDHQFHQSGLNAMQAWSDKWFLKLNINKCKTAFYGRNLSDYKYYLSSTELERVDVIKDLGVVFDSDLTFVSHCKEKINTAYSMLGLIKRNFIYLTEEAFVRLYKSLVRCHLEFANSVWNTYRQALINDLEKVQMRATKLVLTVKHSKYKERLIQLQLPTLRYRRTRGDMIEVYKILTNKYDTNINFSFEKHQDSRTRGHNLKLVSHRHHYDLRKYSFTARIVNTWNSLPESVIAAETTNCFKNSLDKFWNNQEMIFDYKTELPDDVTSAPSLSTFRRHLKTYLFRCCYNTV